MADPGPGIARQLRAIGPLPATVAGIAPLLLCIVFGADPGWGLTGAAILAPLVAGAVLIALGLRLVGETISLFASRGEGTLAPWDPTRRLVVEGPYLRVRNPMISGVFTVLLGETIVLGSPAVLAWCGGFALVNAIYIPLSEEPGLSKRFGERYETYRHNVPRWIPRRTPWISTLGLALAAVLFVHIQAPAIAAEPSPPATGGIVVHSLPQSPAEVREHWTVERMREAEPLDAPGTPARAGTAVAPHYLAQSPDQEISPARDLAYPERIHGRLFVSFGPENASCSATVVTSPNRNLILTAGHCVATPNGEGAQPTFASNVMFVPGYRNGATPFGVYVGTTLRAPVLWSFEADLAFDVGAINLAPSPGGQIENVLGSRGVSFNRAGSSYKKNKTRFQIFGYPAEPAAFYDGERPILCNAAFKGLEGFTASLKAGTCNMKQGSSGGGWVLKGGLVNSVVSHTGCASDQCQIISGTYFGDPEFKLWSAAGGGITKARKKRIRNCKRKHRGSSLISCVSRAETFKPFQP